MANTFGEFFRKKRLDNDMTLREFCREYNLDPGNISKIERGKIPPSLNRIEEYADFLMLSKEERKEFKELAQIAAGRIPDEIIDNEDAVAKLPMLFRAMRGEELSEEALRELAEAILKA